MVSVRSTRPTLGDWRWYLRMQGVRGSGLLGMLGGLAVAVVLVTAMTLLVHWALPDTAGTILAIGIPVVALWLLTVTAVWVVSASRGVRLQRWATSRGLLYQDQLSTSGRVPWRGMPFPSSGRFTVRRLIQGPDDFESGRFRALPTESGTSTFLKPFSFVRFPLPVPVPHLVVTNRRSSTLSWAGISISQGRKLGGSTEFDGVFTLHCPPQYERDALYIFTPNVLAALLDYAPGCELELIDDSAYLYFSREPALWKPEVADALLAVTALLRTTLERQTLRYRDDRAAGAESPSLATLSRSAPPTVGLRGLRLRAGTSRRGRLVFALSWIPFVLAAGWFAWTQFS